MRKTYDFILFDLDGTLIDPMEGITASVAYALAQYGIIVEDPTQLTPFIGPPLVDSFMEFYGFGEEQALEAVEHYRVYFREKGVFQNIPYPGLVDLLDQLQQQERRLMLATSKPVEFAQQILDHLLLTPYFSYVGGASMDGSRSHKQDVIAHVLRENGLENRLEQIVMVGDRKFDCLGAAACGLDSIGVLYGYGSREELEQAGATYLVETLPQLLELLY